jgi:hypothetical protein
VTESDHLWGFSGARRSSVHPEEDASAEYAVLTTAAGRHPRANQCRLVQARISADSLAVARLSLGETEAARREIEPARAVEAGSGD